MRVARSCAFTVVFLFSAAHAADGQSLPDSDNVTPISLSSSEDVPKASAAGAYADPAASPQSSGHEGHAIGEAAREAIGRRGKASTVRRGGMMTQGAFESFRGGSFQGIKSRLSSWQSAP